MSLESKVFELVSPIAEELGVDVLKVRMGGAKANQLVQVLVDRKGGVDSDSLARISRGLALQLDVEDLIEGKFRLELSSPGLDWPLTASADFERYKHEWIQVEFEEAESIEGENLGPDQDGFLIQEEGCEPRYFAMSEVKKVMRAVNWKKVSGGKSK